MSGVSLHGVHAVSQRLTEGLRSYIEAQYHIRDERLIRERRRLLEEPGTVAQVPFVESTPVYQLGAQYHELNAPAEAKEVLTALAKIGAGIFPQPYVHQAQALESFFGNASDLVIATGTGSGKTESFLMPVIARLAIEAATTPDTASLPGCRAFLLYPMNALVNDQLSRIRRLFGSEKGSAIISKGRNRPIRFGSYTGRTPYPGPRSSNRDRQRIAALFEGFYLPLLKDPSKVAMLQEIGQWPAKDLEAFYGKKLEETKVLQSGKSRTQFHWGKRLKTQPGDRELLTRHEMQEACPDLLITNYSMLEYMLMRPIERAIFAQTREWLHSSPKNELIFVLDEAHMYRGAGGAEVALLLRRMIARLEVPRERVRFILTSASLGEGKTALDTVRDFAYDLTGLSTKSARKFEVITGTRETRPVGSAAESADAALASLDISAIENHVISTDAARAAVTNLAKALSWPSLKEDDDLADFLFSRLTGFRPAERLIEAVSGRAVALPALSEQLFPKSAHSGRATDALLALTTLARRKADQRVLSPTRLHLFFRGLPGLYACCNPKCDAKRHASAELSTLGRLHTQPAETCQCSTQSRVYEFLTHRDCGSAFLRGYIDEPHGQFLWHVPSGPLRQGHQQPLIPVELLVEGAPQEDLIDECVEVWLDVKTGHLRYDEPPNKEGYRLAYMPGYDGNTTRDGLRFSSCPICSRTAIRNGISSIMDHTTKGEAPFAHLVKTQLVAQPPVRKESRTFPNGGRKVLLFSDGRQKAARLARDIPREVEQDIFRQLLAVAVHKMKEIGREPKPERPLYKTILSVLRDYNLSIFDREDAKRIENDIEKIEKDHADDSLDELLLNFEPNDTPSRYSIALLKQLCGRHYSLNGTSVGYLLAATNAFKKLIASVAAANLKLSAEDLQSLAIAWIGDVGDSYAINRELPPVVRAKAAGFWSNSWGSDGKFGKPLRKKLPSIFSVTPAEVDALEGIFRNELALADDAGAYFLDPSKLQIQIDLNQFWFHCSACTALTPVALRDCCLACGAPGTKKVDPESSEYVRARKGFWRAPVKAALEQVGELRGISVEEHTAQLSNRDNSRVHATTEQHELRFRDVQIEQRDRPIDVLSCTTTMEVGIDIGSLVAVGLRNVPPQRENYQQRAGRAGRRGTSVSTVITFAQNGPHDSFYYHNPQHIVAGPPRIPEVKVDNPKIARRHITSYLFQTFFHQYMDKNKVEIGGKTSALFRALGTTRDFFLGSQTPGLSLAAFKTWVDERVISPTGKVRQQIVGWLPETLRTAPHSLDYWVIDISKQLLLELEKVRSELVASKVPVPELQEANDDDESDNPIGEKAELLEFLFSRGLLPSYAFPTDLTSFLVERLEKVPGASEWQTVVVERPQQSVGKSLSEYAPGRLVVINKETYRSGGVVANVLPTVRDRAAPIFSNKIEIVHCDACSFVQDLSVQVANTPQCPVCGTDLKTASMVVPEVFTPEEGRALPEDDREQDITYATAAQFPVPVGGSDLPDLTDVGSHIAFAVTTDRKLITMNKGRVTDEKYQGFHICRSCGRAETEMPAQAPHKRPYVVEFSHGQPRAPQQCSGAFEPVFLGHVFTTDLLLMRINLNEPLATDTHEIVVLRALEDAAYSIAEALRMVASRHPQLDLDPSEFGSGFRIVPQRGSKEVFLDIYLYDTLSGGAGYAELAGQHLKDILREVLHLLENCPEKCDRSCEGCLRHYHNQNLTERLDRHIGAQLLRYALDGDVPEERAAIDQASILEPLKRLLELDGCQCFTASKIGSRVAPLLAKKDGKSIAVGIQSGLLRADYAHHSLAALGSHEVLNEYILRRNLPDQHQLVRASLAT